ncbi:MAG: DUF1659 domain-containing protein [Clostridiales bacterium]|jgi:hypothetical protein|nr:DUF1659 domain-containing protein [Clostridiales bacterium]
MALESRPLNTRVQIQFDLGTDGDGKKLTASKSIANIKPDASDEDIFEVVSSLLALQSYPVNYIRKVAQADLVAAE